MRTMLIPGVVVFAVLLGACANTATPGPGADSSGSDAPSLAPEVADRLDAYEAVIRHLVGSEQVDWETIYIMERICANAGDGAEAKGCDEVFTATDQEEITTRLADLGAPIRFVHDYEEADPHGRIVDGREHSVFVWLGPVAAGPEGSLEVPGSMQCGGLCGTGSVWKLEQRQGTWAVVGSAEGAGVWIA
ncbi:MAG: hypothetical protein ABI635_09230 [Actinomycetota bacterium]